MTLAEIMTLENFLAWAEKQIPTEKYYYCDGRACPVALFLIENGFEVKYVLPEKVELEDGSEFPYPKELDRVVLGTGNDLKTDYWGFRNFGALTIRLRELVRQQNQVTEKQL